LIQAFFHWCGTADVNMHFLNRLATGLQKKGAPLRRNQEGSRSNPVAVAGSASSNLKTLHSETMSLQAAVSILWLLIG